MAPSHAGSELIPLQFYFGLSDDIEEGPPWAARSLLVFIIFLL